MGRYLQCIELTMVLSILLSIYRLVVIHDGNPRQSALQRNYMASFRNGSGLSRARQERHYPDALVIGVPKCGSTALMFFLTIHPQIKPIQGELEFLCGDSKYQRGVDYYYSLLPRVGKGDILIERDGTCWRKQLQRRVRETYDKINPNVKLLLVVCEPVNRVISWYTNTLASGKTLPPIEKLIINQSSGGINKSYDGIKSATYDQRFPHWLELFRRERIHIVDGEKMKTDPYHELKRVEAFLGARPFLRNDHFVYNESKGFYCKFVANKGIRCMGSNKGRPHPDVDSSILENLHRYFEPHNKVFEDLTNQKFVW